MNKSKTNYMVIDTKNATNLKIDGQEIKTKELFEIFKKFIENFKRSEIRLLSTLDANT